MSHASRTLAFAAQLPAWMEALRDRAGPMLGAALDLAQWKGPLAFPDGHAGIRRLGKLVEEAVFDESLSDEDDARFVEGAGAMLGLLLIAHVGLGRHRERDGRHRIELGEHGFFDPFGAIDAALDAEHPPTELARRVTMAEAEANGDGPFAKVVGLVVTELERHGPGARIRDRFEAHVTLDDGVELDLARFVALAADPHADVAGAVARLVAMARAKDAGADAMTWEEAAPRLLPRLASQAFVDELTRERGSAPIAYSALTIDIGCALVLAFEGRMRFVRAREVARWSESAGVDPFAHAVAHLDERLDATRWYAADLGGCPCVAATRGDGLAATLLLSSRVRRELGAKLGDPFLVGLPHRDRLVATACDSAWSGLADHVEDEMRRAPHGISPKLYRVSAGADTWDTWIEPIS